MMVGNCFDFPWKSEVKIDPDISLASRSGVGVSDCKNAGVVCHLLGEGCS